MHLRAIGRQFTQINAYFLVMNSKKCIVYTYRATIPLAVERLTSNVSATTEQVILCLILKSTDYSLSVFYRNLISSWHFMQVYGTVEKDAQMNRTAQRIRAIECRLTQMNVFSHYCWTFSANDCVFSLNEQQKV